MSRPDRRLQIMKAAEQLFTSRRYHEITTDDIARDARVGKGTIYRYFRDKDDLFWQIATTGFDEMCALLNRHVPESLPFAERVLRACATISDFFASRRQLIRMMQTEDGREPWMKGKMRQTWRERRRRLVDAVAGILDQGVREGRVRDDLPPDVLADLLLGLLRTRNRELTDETGCRCELSRIVEFFLRGAMPASRDANGITPEVSRSS